MADVVDLAQDCEARERAAAISAALHSRAPDPGPLWLEGVACCRACEAPISPRRLAALPGVGLCVFCAAKAQG